MNISAQSRVRVLAEQGKLWPGFAGVRPGVLLGWEGRALRNLISAASVGRAGRGCARRLVGRRACCLGTGGSLSRWALMRGLWGVQGCQGW